MFCYKCKQDSYTRLCSVSGICAKDPSCVAVEEYLFQGLKAISIYAKKISEYGEIPESFFKVIIRVLYTSIQNVQFDKTEITRILEQIEFTKKELSLHYKELLSKKGFSFELMEAPSFWDANYNINEATKLGERLISKRSQTYDQNFISLLEVLMISLKGIIKNVIQAKYLGIENPKVKKFFYNTLFSLTKDLNKDDLINLILESGKINLIAVEDLERGLEARYGTYERTKVKTSAKAGPAILVSGRDIRDLENILKFTEAKNINIYTHGEMLLAHTLPELRKFKNLAGHYGGISTDQQLEIESFPGPVLITSNCAWNPPQVFRGRIFTTGVPIWMGVKQIINHDYTPLVSAALDSEGFKEEEEEKFTEVGFDVKKFENYMEKIKEGIEKNLIKHVFLVVGCSSSSLKMEYIQEFSDSIPDDTIVINFAGKQECTHCGEINGVPKVLDFGLYNDLFFVLKFFENGGKITPDGKDDKKFSIVFFLRDQTALSVLLSVCTMASQTNSIKIDSCMPAIISPATFKALDDNFGIKKTKTPKEDIEDFMQA
ncbi:MAG: hydroxylamine reductase [Candidatus Gastranaerophilales bacterium]|nr:hydroxylamine reductase [Candidatus Gastranaerophilales bacterium]